MLTKEDIDFIVSVLDKANYTGLKTSMKANEVFLKLQEMSNEQARIAKDNAVNAAIAARDKEVVQEPDNVAQLDNDSGGGECPTAEPTVGDRSDDVCDTVRDSGPAERGPSHPDY